MHICFLTIDYHSERGGGGIASYLSTLAPELVKSGHEVTIIAFGNPGSDVVHGVNVIRIPQPNLHGIAHKADIFSQSIALPIRELEWSRAFWLALRELNAQKPVDVVESTEIGTIFYRPELDPPLIVRTHGDNRSMELANGKPTFGGWLGRQLELAGIRRASRISAVSQYQANAYRSQLKDNYPPTNVIFNPVAADFIQPKPIQLPTASQVLYTGRIERRKGVLILIKAIPTILDAVPDATFVLAGARHVTIDDRELSATLGPLNHDKRVQLVGHVSWKHLLSHYHKTRLFVMPSLYETFGISIVEAMAFGLPVVATKSGGIPEVVDNGVTGSLVDVGDEKQLAEEVIRLLQNVDLAKKLGQQGHQRVHSHFTIDKLLPQFLSLYESVAN